VSGCRDLVVGGLRAVEQDGRVGAVELGERPVERAGDRGEEGEADQ
jgi:hypothetical protein